MRWRGMKLDELPPRTRDDVVKKLDAADAYNKQRDEVRAILKQYPRYDPVQLEAAIRQMEANIVKMEEVIAKEQKEIREYKRLIPLCQERDEKLVAIGERALHDKT